MFRIRNHCPLLSVCCVIIVRENYKKKRGEGGRNPKPVVVVVVIFDCCLLWVNVILLMFPDPEMSSNVSSLLCMSIFLGSPKNSRRSIIKLVKSVPTLQRQDSGSNTSSCNSSTPSSPALPITSPASITSPSPAASPKVVPLPSQFPFPGEDHYPVSCSTPTEPAFFDVFCSQSAYPLNMNANHPANHLSCKALPNLSAVNKPSRHGSFHHFGRASPSSSPVCSRKKSNFHNVHFKRVPLENIPLPSRCACQHVYEHERKLGLYTYPCLNLGSTECVHCRSISTLCFPCFSVSSDKPCKHKDYKDFHASQGLRNSADKVLLSDQFHSGQLKKRVTGIPTVAPAALSHLPQAKGPVQSPLVSMSKLLPSLSSSSSSEYSGVNEQVPHWQYTNSGNQLTLQHMLRVQFGWHDSRFDFNFAVCLFVFLIVFVFFPLSFRSFANVGENKKSHTHMMLGKHLSYWGKERTLGIR